ncbi:MAG: STAS domain-containing protein [Acidobacteriaceae bacterium]
MAIQERAVTVRQLPKTLGPQQERLFLREMQGCMNVDRSRMVLDCSKVHRLDKPVTLLLPCCLEEAMKRHGDVKLAALPPGARAIRELAGASRIFDIYDTTADAVDGFHPLSAAAVVPATVPVHSHRAPEIVA